MEKPVFAANWKMNKTVGEAVSFARKLTESIASLSDREVLLAPPYTALSAVSLACRDSAVSLAGQNMHWEEKGAFTGEISPNMLLDAGCTWVILGHSERRHLFGESDEMVNYKVKAALQHHLKPLVCIGETLEERERERTFNVVGKQLTGGLNNISPGDIKALTIAYEPVWAIGTGKTATPDEAQEVHRFIRKRLRELYGAEAARSVRILYGGSVKESNIKELMGMPDIQGVLVGGASLDVESFLGIARCPLQ
ncbi:MAG TPA: triose-phosphate isomerase [Syntrophales bacterium]|nr:triose-phosphate isomerase [Syntrophales bacterium]